MKRKEKYVLLSMVIIVFKFILYNLCISCKIRVKMWCCYCCEMIFVLLSLIYCEEVNVVSFVIGSRLFLVFINFIWIMWGYCRC